MQKRKSLPAELDENLTIYIGRVTFLCSAVCFNLADSVRISTIKIETAKVRTVRCLSSGGKDDP